MTTPKTTEQRFALQFFQNYRALPRVLEHKPTDVWLVTRLCLGLADSYHRLRTDYEGVSHFAALGLRNDSGRKGAIASKSRNAKDSEAEIERLALEVIRNERRYLGGQQLAEEILRHAKLEGSKGILGAGGAILKPDTVKAVERLRRSGRIPGL